MCLHERRAFAHPGHAAVARGRFSRQQGFIKRILAGLGLSPPEEEKPPPIRDVARVPLDDEGREIQAT